MKPAEQIITCLKNGNKLLICGNGGSAAMANHMSGELICKFEKVRQPLAAISLCADNAVITSIANDFGYEWIFARQIKALGKKGDILITFSTSDLPMAGDPHSLNIYLAQNEAIIMGIKIVEAPKKGNNTAEIQGNQLNWMHNLCREIEKAFI